MYHPLLSDPKNLKDADLELKIVDLTKKYGIAARSGNGNVCSQILCALDMYKEELHKRQTENINKISRKKDIDFTELVNVDK